MASSPSQEMRIPTQTFLLPGQEFCVGLPWERANLPKHGLPPAKAKPAGGTTLDQEDALEGDPCAGWDIGRCEIIRRLSPGSARRLLALRHEDTEGSAVVDVRKLELVDALAPELEVLAASAARLTHGHLARVYPVEVCEEGLFWVSERVSGASLAELMTAGRARGKALPLGLALSAIDEAAQGLGALHERGEGHGLLSDQAIAVGFDGVTKVLDVGLFRVLARRASWAEVLDVTGPYLSPEQVLRGHMPDPKCDVYSLGIVLYECLTGEKLRRGERFEDRVKFHERGQLAPPSSLNVMLPKAVDDVVFRALSADRATRYATAPDFAKALKAAAGSFAWRADKRAEYVGELFATRQKKEAALTAHLAPRRRKPTLQNARAVVIPPPAPRRQARAVPVPAPVVAKPKPPPFIAPAPKRKKKRYQPPSRKPEALASAVGFVIALVAALLVLPSAPAEVASASEPKPVVFDAARVTSADPPMGPAVSAPVSWALAPVLEDAAPAADAPAKKAVASKKKAARTAKPAKAKTKDDAPLPAWLR